MIFLVIVCMILWWLRGFLFGEVVPFFFVLRGCVRFWEGRLCDVFGWRGCIIFLPLSLIRLPDFFCGEVA